MRMVTASPRAHCFVKDFTLRTTTLPKAVNVFQQHIWLGEAGGIGRCTIVRPPFQEDSLVGQVRKIGDGMFAYCEQVVTWDDDDANDQFQMQYKLVNEDGSNPSGPIVNHLSTVVMTPANDDGVSVQWKVEHDSPWWFTPIFHRILAQNVGVTVPNTFQQFVATTTEEVN